MNIDHLSEPVAAACPERAAEVWAHSILPNIYVHEYIDEHTFIKDIYLLIYTSYLFIEHLSQTSGHMPP